MKTSMQGRRKDGKKKNYDVDWVSVKKKYLSGSTFSLLEFGRKQAISYTTLQRHSNGWKKEYTALKEKELETAKDMMVVGNAVKIAEANKRHLEVSKWFIEFCKKNLVEVDEKGNILKVLLEPKTAQDVLKAGETGVMIERKVLGLDRPEIDNSTHITDVHLNIEEKGELEDNISILQKYGCLRGRNIAKGTE